jgi:hypothetical protein
LWVIGEPGVQSDVWPHKRVLLAAVARAASVLLIAVLATWFAPTPQVAAAPRGANGPIFFVSDAPNGGGHVWRMRADGTGAHQLSESIMGDDWPKVSPDGRSVVFISRNFGGSDIYKMRTDGTNVQRLTNNRDMPMHSVASGWSPDGRRIVYTRTIEFIKRIYVMSANGQNQHTVRGNSLEWTLRSLRMVDGSCSVAW